jgi:threonine aldolase
MREAMAKAEVGDDVHGEDPSVNRLQERVAGVLGKEAALFFPSGTMANQAALRVHTRPGDVVIASRDAHILKYEAGAASALSGLQIKTIGREGAFSADDVRGALHPGDIHFAPTTLLAVENTHNAAGGRVLRPEPLADVARVARAAGLALHCDGARLWNAAIALELPPAALAAPFDTVSVCLSKGLGAPAGTVLVGSAELIERAKRIRKMVGGTMRQVGVLGAAGLYALEHHVARLADDHANAERLAKGLAALGIACEPVQTNMVFASFPKEACKPLQDHLRTKDILCFIDPRTRLVTHLDVDAAKVDAFVAAVGAFLSQNARSLSRASVAGE